MEIAILLFDRLTALDAIGPYEVLSRLPGAEVKFVARRPGALRTGNRQLTLVANFSFAQVPTPDILVVPGGPGEEAAREDEHVLNWIRAVHETTTWTTSVCTGALVLGAAGLLDGLDATTHWCAMDLLEQFGARPTAQRVVEQGKIITAAGVSAGIDMGLRLADLVAGPDVAQAIQLSMEYDPQPPFDAGSPATAPAPIVDLVRERAAAGRAPSTPSPV